MKSWLPQLCKYILIYLISLIALTMFIVGSAMIPEEKIKSKMLKSAEYMCAHEVKYMVLNFDPSSEIDLCTDCVTLSIAYQLDEHHPYISSMWTSFYGIPNQQMNQYLLESIKEDLPADHEYLRYWHGSAALMRYLHLMMSIDSIYLLNAILIFTLAVVLIRILLRNKYRWEAVSFIIAMVIVNIWYVPLCLEYTYSILCMLIASLAGIRIALKRRDNLIGPLFLVSGIATVYFDFLTTETLSLLIPLLFILAIKRRNKCTGSGVALTFKCCVLWGIGYLGMWASKWIVASVILQENVMSLVNSHINERLGAPVSGLSFGQYALAAIGKNLKALFPYHYGIWGAVLILVIILVAVIFPTLTNRLRLRTNINYKSILLYMLLSVIPIIRFVILRNHSYIHYFFTHRALASSIVAICFILGELVEINPRKAVTHSG